MESIIRAVVVYAFLLLIFRLSGKRTMAEATPFDMILLLVISETTQEALVDSDYSITNCFILVTTLVLLDIGISIAKQHFKKVEKTIDGLPLIILENGKPIDEYMKKARIDKADILESARESHGLGRLDQIKYAVLETNGSISIIPKESEK